MKIKVTVYGVHEGFNVDFFNHGADFHRGINYYFQQVLHLEYSCEQIEVIAVPSKDGDIPHVFIAEFVFPNKVDEIEQLRRWSVLFGHYFNEYVYNRIDCNAFVGVLVSDGIHVVKWYPHQGAEWGLAPSAKR